MNCFARKLAFVSVLGLMFAPLAIAQTAGQAPPQQPPQTPPTPPANPQPGVVTPGAPGSQPYVAPGDGRLTLSMDNWDFGTKWFGEDCATEVTISNAGTGPLTIMSIRSSCGCTVAKPVSGGAWNGKVLAPGETDKMALTYNTKKGVRTVSQKITIETNDRERPKVEFEVKGEVKNAYDFKPDARVTFSRLERESKATEVIDMTNNMPDKVFLKLRPGNYGSFDVQLQEVEPGMKYKLLVSTKPPLNLGSNTTEIVLETGMDRMPSMQVPVSAYISPRVSVTPRQLLMSPKVTTPFQKIVRVNYLPDKQLTIKEVKVSHDSIKAEILPQQPDQQANRGMKFYEIRVSLPASKDFPADGAKLTILTDDPSPEYQTLEVPIMTQAQFQEQARRRGTIGAGAPSVPAEPGATPPAAPAEPEKPAQGGEEKKPD